VLAGLTPQLTEISFPVFLPLWQELFKHLARRSRQELFFDLQALTPVIAKLGGEEAIADLFHAIQDVGQWWP
jgi:hypothetical protein